MIRLEKISRVFSKMKRPAVNNVSLDIQSGDICVFVGPSGCGKTTILRMINRLVEPTSGSIFINGKNIKDIDPDQLRRGIGYVIQQVGLLPHRNIAQNIALVPVLLKWPQEKIKSRVQELLQMVGLDPGEIAAKYPHQLSGGQMQRVGVARAMAADPPIMLMDEPFGAVDPIIRSRLQDEFLRLQKNIKKTICFVTHDIDEAIKMGDKIVILNEGQLVQYGSPLDILSRPANKFVGELIGKDRGVKLLNLIQAEALLAGNGQPPRDFNKDNIFIKAEQPVKDALEMMMKNNSDVVKVCQGEATLGYITWSTIKEYINTVSGEDHG